MGYSKFSVAPRFVRGLPSHVVCEVIVSVFRVRRIKSVESAQANHTPNTQAIQYSITSVSVVTTGTFVCF